MTILFKSIRPNPYSSIPKIGYGHNVANLIPLTNSADISLRISLKLFLSVLPLVRDPYELPSYMNLKADEVSELLSLLDRATSEEFVEFNFSVFTLAELLSSLTIFAKMASNCVILHSSGITKVLFKVLESEQYDIQKMGLELAISLLQCGSVCQNVFTAYLDFTFLLRFLSYSPCLTINVLAMNALSLFQWNLDDGEYA